ncbi:hypothetical protein K488DRAFT_27942, partial [Vararia minispora EC-137]
DIAGVFPNAVPHILTQDLHHARVPEAYTTFIERLLTNRHTMLAFDDFVSEPFPVTNGIGQVDSLSMLLYLFYNADLLCIPHSAHEAAAATVDDVTFLA